jgi:hypothetical protein
MARQDIELHEREQELYTIIDSWPDVRALVVGGYAASAWSFPRFSHDLDFLVAQDDARAIRDHLVEHDLRLVDQRPRIEQNYGGSWERWEGGEQAVTIDLLINSIQDRDFQVPTPHEELWKDRSTRRIRGVSESTVELPVISKESLIALKAQPMRARDIGDICAIAYAGYDVDRLHHLLSPVIQQKPDLFQQRVKTFKATVGDTPETLQRSLGPRIPRFSNIREDMHAVLTRLLTRFDRWTDHPA